MANDMVTNVIESENFKQNELIYFASIICQTLTEIERTLKLYFPDDNQIKLLLSVKNQWIDRFKSMTH